MTPVSSVECAVIPAAGRGTRMRPLSVVVPKEMFPVGLRPMLEHTVAEAVRSGVRRLCMVVAPDKEPLIREYFETFPPDLHVEYAVQPEPMGLMDAVRRARTFTAGERFAVLLPDNFFIGRPVLAQILEAPVQAGQHVVGVLRATEEMAEGLGARGALNLAPIEGDARSFRVEAVGPEKTPIRVGADGSAPISLGRYIFAPDIFDAIDDEEARLDEGELDDVPIMNRLAGQGKVLGRLVEAEYYDVGNPLGYWRANRRVGPLREPEV